MCRLLTSFPGLLVALQCGERAGADSSGPTIALKGQRSPAQLRRLSRVKAVSLGTADGRPRSWRRKAIEQFTDVEA